MSAFLLLSLGSFTLSTGWALRFQSLLLFFIGAIQVVVIPPCALLLSGWSVWAVIG